MKAPQKSLKDWTDQKWTTKSGKPSAKTGERYLPEAAIKSLSSLSMQPPLKPSVKVQRLVSSLLNNLKTLLRK